MKIKRIYQAIILTLMLIGFDPGPTRIYALESISAEASEQSFEEDTLSDAPAESGNLLRFFAVNAGYKNDVSQQNYDFIALQKTDEENLGLAPYKIVYFNSNGNEAGTIKFDERQDLQSELLVLGFAKSPQYQDAPEEYLYNFGSAGLATTSGKLVLYEDDELLEELCWGKAECEEPLAKFSTDIEENFSYVLREDGFVQEKYYPEIDDMAIFERAPEEELEEEGGSDNTSEHCGSLRITEIYSFYEQQSSEQFIEIYNPGKRCSLEGLNIGYKNKKYALHDIINQNEYLAIFDKDLVLTKNPTSSNSVTIISDDGEILDEVSYPHGQKAGLSYALIGLGSDEHWELSYARTPGAENIYQQFQTCPEGKVINETTGNCINAPSTSETVCPEGKYLNPETNRCKNIEDDSLAECAEGYERNPETNRCRKIQEADGSEYAPKTAVSEGFSEPQRFIAYGALFIAIAAGTIYICLQYREEIARFMRAVFAKIAAPFRKITSGRKLARLG